MIDRAIVEQALEAMERYQVKRQDFDRFADEITALRAALEEQAQDCDEIEGHVLRGLLGASLGALLYHTKQTRPIVRTEETIAAIEHAISKRSQQLSTKWKKLSGHTE